LIILDTSTLLNLFRYPLAARDRLLTILERFAERLWLPHQAALEYHVNQQNVRLEQITRFRQVREEVGALKAGFKDKIEKLQLKRRHALINVEDLLSKVEGAIDAFQSELNQIEREQEDRYQEGSLQEKIEQLFEQRVGRAPTQEFLDALYKEGARRYEHKIPPGYQDSQKGELPREPPAVSFGGLLFLRRYGDLILWKEILQKTKLDGIHWFIFITDDAKDDWWQIVGGQRIGPRPELLDEAFREGGVEGFLLESSERFMEHAARILNLEVSEELIRQISITKKSENLPAQQEEAGFLEKLLAAGEGFPGLINVAAGIGLELDRIRGIMEDGTQRLKNSIDIRMQARITNDTALQISAAAESFKQRVIEFDVILVSRLFNSFRVAEHD
jgi:PIN domain-containing protein